MRGRLWLVNILLLGAVALSASVLRQRWLESRQREQKMLQTMLPSVPSPVLTPMGRVAPAVPSSYLDVAQKMVFARDRNPNVILDPPPPPPPPPPMPALPVAYGIMNLGAGPSAILAEKAGAKSKIYQAGEKIGEFKIVAMNNQEILFEWNGKQIKRRLEEMVDRTVRNAPPPPPAQSAAAPAAAAGVTTVETAKSGPGVDMGADYKACVPGDPAPAGTIQDGMRKVINKTPFGEACRWEKVK